MNTRRLATTLAIALAMPGAVLAQRPAEEELVWPLPPEAPRIRYIGQLSNEQDIGRSVGFFSKLKNKVSGTQSSVLGVQRPHDVHVDGGTRFFISDGARSKVVLFNKDSKSAMVLGEGGVGNLRKPMGVGGDGAGTVYVADASGARVVAFDRNGEYLRAYGGESVLLNPVDVAVDPANDRLYVVDSYLHQIVVFSIETGEFVQRIGKNEDDLVAKREALAGSWEGGIHGAREEDAPEVPEEEESHAGTPPRDLTLNRGSGPGEFRYPAFVAVAPDGTMYVTDQMNFRVQAFSPDGTFLREIGKIGQTPGSFSRPKGLAVDTEGHLYVADGLFNNVQIFDPDGQLLLVFGSIGTGEGQLYLPLGVQIDGDNRIYIADRYNNRIQVYEFLGSPTVAEGTELEGAATASVGR